MPTDRSARRRRRSACLFTAVLMLVGLVLGGYGINTYVLPQLVPQGCRVDGGEAGTVSYTPEQTANAATIAAIGTRRELPERAVTIALATAMQESKLRNLDHGDRDSLGLFQQRPSQGWGTPAQVQDPVYASTVFYRHLEQVDGYLARPLTDVAQDVQRSGFPEAYAKHETRAAILAAAFTGTRPGAVTCRLDDATTSAPPEQIVTDLTEQVGVPPQSIEINTGGQGAADGDSLVAVVSTERLAWATASWVVAHADRIGATSVTVGDRRWQRGRTERATSWHPTGEGGAPTEVAITLAARS